MRKMKGMYLYAPIADGVSVGDCLKIVQCLFHKSMPIRNISRQLYFDELARTSEKFFLPYLDSFVEICDGGG